MLFVPTQLPGVVIVRPQVHRDERGVFYETWQERAFAEAGIEAHFVQDNHSHSVRGALRGLHYQIRQPQGKLVRVVRGAVFDVVVDVRRSSPNFGRWVGVELSETNRDTLWVPPGFAHGYLALSESIDLIYKCTAFYAIEYERSIRWNDPRIAITWPLLPEVAPTLSQKDASAPLLEQAETYA
jgi:dTDP-4-dehydrorhamnose 3,5-epimerase